ncbi:hypothetical protein N7534_007341 [Penicillium rubens]|nr:hypothetical protein N7534_007341 [Penicillium rubens]
MAIITAALPSDAPHYVVYAVPLLFLLYLALNYFYNSLHIFPGPFWAHFTDIWRYIDVRGRRPEVTHIALHRKYGDIVRLGPRTLSFADPKATKVIYGLNKGFTKSEFYPVQMTVSKGEPLPSLFSTLDESFHANLRRSVNNAFSMSSLVQYEPMVDETTEIFLNQTDRLFADGATVCDFARWLQFFAFDVIGSITYSKRHGFIEKNEDIDGIVKSLANIFDYSAPVGQMPWLDKLFWKNPIFDILQKLGLSDNSHPVAVFAKQRMQERMSAKGDVTGPGAKDDLLTRFIKAGETRPDFMTNKRILTMATSMAFAGSETTAISIAAVFYYILKSPECMRRVKQELDHAVANGTIANRPTGLVSWTESRQLPYLDACIKEAFRMHPAAGLPLERVVPASGLEISGHFIRGGTIVGCSPWVIHRRTDIFGPDADVYNPDRWLTAPPDQLKAMDGMMLQFGAGATSTSGPRMEIVECVVCTPT